MATPLFTVEIGLASATSSFTLDLTQLSPATAPAVDAPLGSDQGYAWTDVSEYVMEGLTFRRGSTRSQGPFWRYEAGTASIELDNVDGRFDPLNLSGPYVSAGISEIRPNLPVRISAVIGSTTETMWVGVVDSVDLDYASVTWSTVKLLCVDGVAWLQAADLPELTTAVGAGDTVAARITRILDRVGWPAARRDLDPVTANTLQASTLAASAWADILLSADSDAGYVWFDRRGNLVYRTRGAIPALPSLTFSSSATTAGKDFTAITITRDVEQVFNSVSLARKDGTAVTVEDVDSQALIGQVRGYSRSDLLCETNVDVENVASWIIGNYSDLLTRVEEITVDPPADTDLLASDQWWELLRLEMGDVVRVVHATPDGRDVDVEAVVRGVEWSAGTRSFGLKVSLQTQNPAYELFVLDDAVRGVLAGTDGATTYTGTPLSLLSARSA
jgi:hypothetical protein